MYKVYCDNQLIYSAEMQMLALDNPVLSIELNTSGSFTFGMFENHPYYNLPKKLKSVIEVTNNDTTLFIGRVLNEKIGWHNKKTLECEGCLGFLNDSIIEPYDFESGDNHTSTVDLFTYFINKHNEQVDNNAKLKVGVISVVDGYIVKSNSYYQSTYENIKTRLLDSFGGYIVPRYQSDGIYLDWLEDFNLSNTQRIQIGDNLKNLERQIDGADIITRLIPLGARNEETGEYVTIESVNSGKKYVENAQAKLQYGIITKTMIWDNVTTPSALLGKANDYLQEAILQKITLSVEAIDLSNVDQAEAPLKVGKYVYINSPKHGINTQLLINKMVYNLTNPANDTLVLDKSVKGATSLLNNQSDAVKVIAENTSAEVVDVKKDVAQLETSTSTKFSEIEQSIEGITQRVVDIEGDYVNQTTLEQTASGIRIDAQGYASAAEGNAKSYSDAQLTIKAGEIQSNVTQQINGIATGGSNLEAYTNTGSDNWNIAVGERYYAPSRQSVAWLKTNAIKIISNGVKDSSSDSNWFVALHNSTDTYRLNKILKPDTTYTLSYDVYYSGGAALVDFNFVNIMNGSYRNAIGTNLEVVSSNRRMDELGREYVHTVRRITTVSASSENWAKNDALLYFGVGRMETSGAYYVVANIMLVEGTVEKAWERSIFDTETSIATNTTNITQNAQQIALKASQSEVDTLSGKVNTNTTNITQNANDIVLSATSLTNAINTKANQSSVDEITRSVVISSSGVDIKKNGSNSSYSHFDETGMKVYVNNNVVAEATSSQFVVEGQGGIKVQGWSLTRGSNANVLNLTKG